VTAKKKKKPAKTRTKKAAAAPKARKPSARPGRGAQLPAPGDGAGKGGNILVVVESPTKAKTIGKYLGSGYTVKATVGHIRDLPRRELGVDVDNGFTPKYVTIKEKAKTLTDIKKAAKRA